MREYCRYSVSRGKWRIPYSPSDFFPRYGTYPPPANCKDNALLAWSIEGDYAEERLLLFGPRCLSSVWVWDIQGGFWTEIRTAGRSPESCLSAHQHAWRVPRQYDQATTLRRRGSDGDISVYLWGGIHTSAEPGRKNQGGLNDPTETAADCRHRLAAQLARCRENQVGTRA